VELPEGFANEASELPFVEVEVGPSPDGFDEGPSALVTEHAVANGSLGGTEESPAELTVVIDATMRDSEEVRRLF